MVDLEDRKEKIKKLADRFLVLSDFRRAHPKECAACYNSGLDPIVFSHMKRPSDITKQEAFNFATKLTVEELLTDHCFLAAKICRDNHMLELLNIIENKPENKVPF